jgi:hypothetical protein
LRVNDHSQQERPHSDCSAPVIEKLWLST